MSNKPPETSELEETKKFLLSAIRTDKVSPSQDALNYAAAYHYLVNAEVAKEKADKKE